MIFSLHSFKNLLESLFAETYSTLGISSESSPNRLYLRVLFHGYKEDHRRYLILNFFSLITRRILLLILVNVLD